MDISDNVHSLTLTYFMNPNHFQKYQSSGAIQCAQQEKEKQRIFYRRRIIQATKDLSRGKCMSEDLASMYNVYADKLIEYFRIMDRHDIMEASYKDISAQTKIDNKQEVISTEQQEQQDISILSVRPQKNSTASEAMERFVVREKKSVHSKPDYPSIKNISLNEPALRNKGVDKRQKKKKKSN